MLYTIGQVAEMQSKSSGKMYKRVNVKDPSGVVTNGVAVFSSTPFYSQVVTNAQVEGILKEKDYNGSKSYTLEAPYQPRSGGGAMPAKMMEKKQEFIKEAQDDKQQAIKISSTFTAAWNTAIASFGGKGFTQDEFAKDFKMWRRYFVNNYEVEENPALTSHGTEVPWPEDKSSTLNNDSDDGLDSFNSNSIPF